MQHEEGLISLDLTAITTNISLKKWLRLFEKPIKSLTKISVFEKYLNQVDHDKSELPYWEKWLRHLQIYCKNSGTNERPISSEGAAIFIANEPLGLLSNIALAAIVTKVRADVKILANSSLQPLFGLTDDLIGMGSFEAGPAISEDDEVFTESLGWLNNGGALIIFPNDDFAKSMLNKLTLNSPAAVVSVCFHDKNNRHLTPLASIRICLRQRGSTILYSFTNTRSLMQF